MSDQHLRISDAEREQAAADLGEHYAQGRLSAEEHGERLDQIWASRTRAELGPVFTDLPGHATAVGAAPQDFARGPWPPDRVGPWRRGMPLPLMVLLGILLVVTVLTHLPIILIGVLVWYFVIARHRNHHQLHRR